MSEVNKNNSVRGRLKIVIIFSLYFNKIQVILTKNIFFTIHIHFCHWYINIYGMRYKQEGN